MDVREFTIFLWHNTQRDRVAAFGTWEAGGKPRKALLEKTSAKVAPS